MGDETEVYVELMVALVIIDAQLQITDDDEDEAIVVLDENDVNEQLIYVTQQMEASDLHLLQEEIAAMYVTVSVSIDLLPTGHLPLIKRKTKKGHPF